MKKFHILIFVFLFIAKGAAQDGLKAYFKSSLETIQAGSDLEITHSIEIIVPKQQKYKDAIVEVFVENNFFSPDPSQIFLQEDNIIKVSGEDDQSKIIKVKFPRDTKDDRVLTLKLRAFDENKSPVTIESSHSTFRLYIKPLQKEISEEETHGYQLWFLTGTNFDFLDGIRAKDLYFKGSYLFNIRNNSKETNHWVLATFGKNRYSTALDSIKDITFQQPLLVSAPYDNIQVLIGYYNTVIQTTTENIFASVEYLYHIKALSNKNSRVFVNGGLSWGLQNIKTSYKNSITVLDTLTFPISDMPERFNSPAKEIKFKRLNNNIGVGLTHILSTKKMDVKTKFISGLNYLTFPRRIVRNDLITREYFEQEKNLFFTFNTEATIWTPGFLLDSKFF